LKPAQSFLGQCPPITATPFDQTLLRQAFKAATRTRQPPLTEQVVQHLALHFRDLHLLRNDAATPKPLAVSLCGSRFVSQPFASAWLW
jgi:hypothetical protein